MFESKFKTISVEWRNYSNKSLISVNAKNSCVLCILYTSQRLIIKWKIKCHMTDSTVFSTGDFSLNYSVIKCINISSSLSYTVMTIVALSGIFLFFVLYPNWDSSKQFYVHAIMVFVN
jgi:hypothetical protein